MKTVALQSWRDVVSALRSEPAGSVLRFPKGILPHSRTFRMSPSIGLPVGQTADYRKVLRDGSGLHVQDHGQHYEVHFDAVHPDVDLIEHARRDAPAVFIGGGAALGALLGSALGKSKESTVVGAALGGLIAAMMAAADPEKKKNGKVLGKVARRGRT